MKCEHCPLKNCVRSCEGERSNRLCGQEKYIELFKLKANSNECNTDNTYPPPSTMVKNFIRSIVDYVVDGMHNVSREIAEERYEICKKCERFDPSWSSCYECGCYLPEKVTMRVMECPLGKWKAVDAQPLPEREKHSCCPSD